MIIEVANAATGPDELLVTIVQVGDDAQGLAYLNELDSGLDKLGCKHDILDLVSHA